MIWRETSALSCVIVWTRTTYTLHPQTWHTLTSIEHTCTGWV